VSRLVGVLALQGDFEAHQKLLSKARVDAIQVRTPAQLAAIDALVIPGGESTTIGKLATDYGLVDAIRARAQEGMAILGTCAGLIVCAARVAEGDSPLLGLVDITARRNAYGRQVDSFEADVQVHGIGAMRAVFIRAPWIDDVGPGVDVLAVHDGRPVVVRQGPVVLASFHPEMAGDDRLHRLTFDLGG
jgi:5'-phosphate synthase pdxT subunit